MPLCSGVFGMVLAVAEQAAALIAWAEAAVRRVILKITYFHSVRGGLADLVRDWIIGRAYLEHVHGQIESLMKQERQKPGKMDRVIDVTVIAHGAIGQPFIPCDIHYTSSSVRSVTFYQPWGCLLGSTGAYGISKKCISMDNRQFDDPKFDPPTHWNTIPNDTTAVPLVYLSPVDPTEKVWQELKEIKRLHGYGADGIEFQYVSAPGSKQLPPLLPLPRLCSVIGTVASALGATVNVRVASCLGWDDNYSHARMTQYHSVPYAVMHCDLERGC